VGRAPSGRTLLKHGSLFTANRLNLKQSQRMRRSRSGTGEPKVQSPVLPANEESRVPSMGLLTVRQVGRAPSGRTTATTRELFTANSMGLEQSQRMRRSRPETGEPKVQSPVLPANEESSSPNGI
jgi:hypothetical protein